MSRPHRLIRLTIALMMTAVLLPAAAAADDFELAITALGVDSLYVLLNFNLTDPLPAEDEQAAPPAALAYTVELWRDRSGWFDGLVSSRTYGFRLDYDHIERVYRIATPNGRIESLPREDAVVRLCRQVEVPAARRSDLKADKKYYFAVTARLTPIDINKLGEVEGWLSGEIRGRKGGVLGIPKTAVGILADVAGLGDRSTVARGGWFQTDDELRITPMD